MVFNQIIHSSVDSSLLEAAKQAYHETMQQDLPVLKLPYEPHLATELEPIAEFFRDAFETVVVLGTGGSSLGAQTLVALAQDCWGFERSGPELVFLDNIDPDTFERFFRSVDFSTTGFLVVSKSGTTAETICQLQSILQVWEHKTEGRDPMEHFVVITEPKDSPMTKIARQYGFRTLDHDPKMGGRFAALSLVGLLPAMIAGLDAQQILAGAKMILEHKDQGSYEEGAAWTMEQHRAGQNISVMMPYCDRLFLFCKWYRQLWAESLGKDGKGITPIAAYGTVDQHSQLQLYLDGPDDKIYTVVATPHKGQGVRIDATGAFAGHTIGDLMEAEQQATIETLKRCNRPVRVLNVPVINEASMGALMMHFMLETMLTAKLLGVNAFDQPAVEQGKILAMQYLSEDKAA